MQLNKVWIPPLHPALFVKFPFFSPPLAPAFRQFVSFGALGSNPGLWKLGSWRPGLWGCLWGWTLERDFKKKRRPGSRWGASLAGPHAQDMGGFRQDNHAQAWGIPQLRDFLHKCARGKADPEISRSISPTDWVGCCCGKGGPGEPARSAMPVRVV